jgi:hypothetical protein
MKANVRDTNAAASGDSFAVSGAVSAAASLIDGAARIVRTIQTDRVKKIFEFAGINNRRSLLFDG